MLCTEIYKKMIFFKYKCMMSKPVPYGSKLHILPTNYHLLAFNKSHTKKPNS